jgi:hypothetical protein
MIFSSAEFRLLVGSAPVPPIFTAVIYNYAPDSRPVEADGRFDVVNGTVVESVEPWGWGLTFERTVLSLDRSGDMVTVPDRRDVDGASPGGYGVSRPTQSRSQGSSVASGSR